jgi:hypothetical protein
MRSAPTFQGNKQDMHADGQELGSSIMKKAEERKEHSNRVGSL